LVLVLLLTRFVEVKPPIEHSGPKWSALRPPGEDAKTPGEDAKTPGEDAKTPRRGRFEPRRPQPLEHLTRRPEP